MSLRRFTGKVCRRGLLARSALVLSLVAGGMLLSAGPAAAISGCGGSNYHDYAQQYNNNTNYWGEFGWYYTYNPTVYDIYTDFTVSHAYIQQYYASVSFVEVGWYKGYGPQRQVSVPYYYAVHEDQYSGYQETDFNDYPNLGSSRLYELLYTGHDYTTNKAKWSFYYRDQTSPKLTAEVASLDGGEPLAGGEVDGQGSDGTQIQVHGTPEWQVENHSNTWLNWTTAISTVTCADPGFSYKANTAYTDFSASGHL